MSEDSIIPPLLVLCRDGSIGIMPERHREVTDFAQKLLLYRIVAEDVLVGRDTRPERAYIVAPKPSIDHALNSICTTREEAMALRDVTGRWNVYEIAVAINPEPVSLPGLSPERGGDPGER